MRIPSLEAPHKLRPARTRILMLLMRKLRFTLIQSLARAPMISDEAGTSKPVSSDSQSLMQQRFLIFS